MPDSIEELGLEPLRHLMSQLGLQSIPLTAADRKVLDVSDVAGQVMRRLGLHTYVSLAILADIEFKEENVFAVSHPFVRIAIQVT